MRRSHGNCPRTTLRAGEVLETTDFDVAVAAASATQHQLTAEFSSRVLPLRFSIRQVSLPSMSVALVRFRHRGRYTVRAGPAGHFYHLNVPLRGAFDLRHGRRSIRAEGGLLGLLLSPLRATRFDGDGDFDEFTVNIERAVLEAHLATLTGVEVREPIDFEPGVDLRRGMGARLKSLLSTLVEYSRLGEPPAEIALAEEAVLDTILLGLEHDYRDAVEQAPVAAGRRLVRQAEEFMEAHATFPLTIAAVARALRVSARTLQRAFRLNRGCTPQQFLKRIRLDHAMRLLRRGDPTTNVTIAATRSGFGHLGQFSVDFRRRFRESPSETLRRSRV